MTEEYPRIVSESTFATPSTRPSARPLTGATETFSPVAGFTTGAIRPTTTNTLLRFPVGI